MYCLTCIVLSCLSCLVRLACLVSLVLISMRILQHVRTHTLVQFGDPSAHCATNRPCQSNIQNNTCVHITCAHTIQLRHARQQKASALLILMSETRFTEFQKVHTTSHRRNTKKKVRLLPAQAKHIPARADEQISISAHIACAPPHTIPLRHAWVVHINTATHPEVRGLLH